VIVVGAEPSGAPLEPRTVERLEDAIAAAPAPLWGWPENSGGTLGRALTTTGSQTDPLLYARLDEAVQLGVAVELQYDLGELEPVELLEGPRAQMRALLQQTPARWTESEQRVLPIAGAGRPAWVMHGPENRRWVIFEIDNTLIVLRYQGQQTTDALLSKLEQLVPLKLGAPKDV
jgi:hypothetical protein